MKRTLKILLLAALYVLALSFALKVIPFDKPPDIFRALFSKISHSELAWAKLKEVLIIAVIAWILALIIIRENAENALFDAVVIGILTVLWGLVFRWAIIGGVGLSWYEATDYLTTGLAVPVLVAAITKCTRGKRQHPIG
jgi:hypothetical protein